MNKKTAFVKWTALLAACLLVMTCMVGCGGKDPVSSAVSTPQGDESGTPDVDTSVSTTAGEAGETTTAATGGDATTTAPAAGDGGNKTTTGKTQTKTTKAYSNDSKVDGSGYTFVIGSGFFNDVMDPQVAEMIAEIKKQFKCKVKINFFWPSLENMQKKIASGDKVGDIVDMPADLMLQSAMAGYLRPLNEIAGIDVKDSRWIAGATNLSTIQGKTWGVSFWFPPGVRTCVFYNRDLLKANGVTADMEALVKNGGWTFDKFREFAKKTTKDTNGDGVYDTFGMGFSDPDYAALNFIAANGGGLAGYQNGKVVETFSNEQTLAALNFYNQLINQDKVAKISDSLRKEGGSSDVDMDTLFVNGKMAFYVTESWKAVQAIKPKADKLDYGILPLPKGPNAKDYVSPAENYSPLFCITSTNKDLDKSVPILNYLGKYFAQSFANDGWKDDVALDYFKSGDKASLEMYEYILDRSALDVGYTVDNLRTNFYSKVIRKAIYQQNGTPAEAIKAQKGLYTKDLNAVFNK